MKIIIVDPLLPFPNDIIAGYPCHHVPSLFLFHRENAVLAVYLNLPVVPAEERFFKEKTERAFYRSAYIVLHVQKLRTCLQIRTTKAERFAVDPLF